MSDNVMMSEGALALQRAAREASTYEEMEPARLFAIARGETPRDQVRALQNELAFLEAENDRLEERVEELDRWECDECVAKSDEIADLHAEIDDLEAQVETLLAERKGVA